MPDDTAPSWLGGAQSLAGGPNALTNMAAYGLLGAGLGFGGASAGTALVNAIAPGTLDRRQAVRNATLAGALLGGGLWPAYRASVAYRAPGSPAAGSLWRALTTTWPNDGAAAAGAPKTGSIFPLWLLERLSRGAGGASRVKVANDEDGAESDTGLFTPSIPVDAFNNAVWLDVRARANPFGTRSPFESARAPLTPPPAALAVTSTVSAAGRLAGAGAVSPYHVAKAAVLGGGAGWLGGLVLGKTVGRLAAMSPGAQAAARRTGLWAGAVTGAARAAFGGD